MSNYLIYFLIGKKEDKEMKRKVFLALVMVLVLMFSVVPVSAISEDQYSVEDGVCQLTGTITSFSELADLARDSSVHYITFLNADIQTNNLWELQELGNDNDGTGTAPVSSPIPSITIGSTLQKSIRAFKELPLYDVATGTFAQAHNTRTIDGIQYPQDFKWRAEVTYVYDDNRDNSVSILHQVTDKSGLAMLQYRNPEGDEFPEDYNINVENDTVDFLHINAPQTETGQSYLGRVLYSDVLWGYTMLNETEVGSPFSGSVSYRYEVVPRFYSAVGLDLNVSYLGAVEIVKVDPENKPLEGASFMLYSDEGCKTEATRYDVNTDTFVAVGERTTGADGKITIDGLKEGTYYAKETKAPEGFLLNEEAVALTVAGQYGNVSLSLTGGEGTSVTINKEESTFEPNWTGNAKNTGTNPLMAYSDDTETVNVSSYGKDVFIKNGGDPVGFEPLDQPIADAVDASAINAPTYHLTVGDIAKDFTSLSDLLAYINDTLIADGTIDAANARDLVDITVSEDVVYLAYTGVAASATVVDEYIPVDVTINKSWKNDSPAQRGEYLLVQLMCDGEPCGEPVELNEENNWSYTWTNLPGNHNYTVDEPDVPENYVMTSTTETEKTEEKIYITVNMTNEYVNGAAPTFDGTARLILVAAMMVMAVLYLRKKISMTPTK